MNTMQPENKRGPGRPRKEEVQERRKSRRGGGYIHGKRMGVNEDLLDFKKYNYRFVNDDPGRLVALTKHDDWEIVTGKDGTVKEDHTDLGDAVSFIVGTNADGKAKRAYLCRKKREWYEDDQADKRAALDEQLAQLQRGQDRAGADQSDYVPPSGIRVQ